MYKTEKIKSAKTLFTILTFKYITFKMSPASCGTDNEILISFIKVRHAFRRHMKMPSEKPIIHLYLP